MGWTPARSSAGRHAGHVPGGGPEPGPALHGPASLPRFGPTELLTYLNVDEFNVLILHLEIVGPELRAALGRAGASSKQAAAPPAQVLRWGPLRMDLGRREAWWAARRLDLTSMQFRLLATLVLAEGCVVPALELSRRAFGSAVAHHEERVQAHVRRIRKLIEADPSHPRFLVTVRGEGFRLAGIPCQATAGCLTARRTTRPLPAGAQRACRCECLAPAGVAAAWEPSAILGDPLDPGS